MYVLYLFSVSSQCPSLTLTATDDLSTFTSPGYSSGSYDKYVLCKKNYIGSLLIRLFSFHYFDFTRGCCRISVSSKLFLFCIIFMFILFFCFLSFTGVSPYNWILSVSFIVNSQLNTLNVNYYNNMRRYEIRYITTDRHDILNSYMYVWCHMFWVVLMKWKTKNTKS